MCKGGRGGRPRPPATVTQRDLRLIAVAGRRGRPPLPTFPFAKSRDQQFAKPCDHAIDPLAVRIGDAGGDSGAHIDEERIDDLLVLCIQRIVGAVEQAEPKRFLPNPGDTVSQGLSDVNRKSSPEGVENELLPFAIAVRLTM